MTAATARALTDRPHPALQRRSAELHHHHSTRRFHVLVSDAPSQRNDDCAEAGARVSRTIHRNAATLRKEVEQQLSDALSEAIPTYVAPAKTVAREIGTSTGTVENLRQRVPDAMVTLVMLGRAYPKLGSQVARLMALDAEMDPGFQREFAEFLRRAREA